jgi:transposase
MQVAILGVDIAKKKFDVALIVGTKERHKVFNNDNDGFERCLQWCTQHGADKMHICLEATSWYGENLAEYMHAQGHKVSMVNPARIRAYSTSKGLRHKTDKTDSCVIAEFCKVQNPATWQPRSSEERRLRDLYRCLQNLKDDVKRILNRLENKNKYQDIRVVYEKLVEEYNQKISDIEKLIKEIVNNNADLKNKVERLQEIKGIGWLTAITMLAEMPAVENFDSARAYAAFAGLSPRHYRSGSSVRGRGSICKVGSSQLRKALYMPAIVVKNHNKYFKIFCDNLANKGKAGKVIVVALMRKLMHIIFGVLKHGDSFKPELAFTKNWR